jgi:hypothetical protein
MEKMVPLIKTMTKVLSSLKLIYMNDFMNKIMIISMYVYISKVRVHV